MSKHGWRNVDTAVIDQATQVVPRGWGPLLKSDLATTLDSSSLPGIARTVYEPPFSSGVRRHGEIWSLSASQNPASTVQVTSGTLELFFLSGSDVVTKNGNSFPVRAGEKVSFGPGDTFSFSGNTNAKILVRNEDVSFAPACAPTPTPAQINSLSMPSRESIEAIRAQLGIHLREASHHSTPHSMRREETSSRAYRTNRGPY